MRIWPSPTAAPAADISDAAIGSLLALLADALPAGACVLLATQIGPDRMIVADGGSHRDLLGRELRVPAGLLMAIPTQIETRALRLSLAWTMACGQRPTLFAAVPVPDRGLHVVAALCIATGTDTAVAPARLTAVAEVIGRLLAGGQPTQVQTAAAARVQSLVRHLPVPVVFVDAFEPLVFINDEARTLLALAPDEMRHAKIARALANLLHLEADQAPPGGLSAEPEARLGFEIRRAAQTFRVDSRWIEDGGLSGRIWVFADVTEAKALQASLSRLAREDVLTGVLNRRAFDECIATATHAAMRDHSDLALLTLDLDHFKAINDTHGHQAGDHVLHDVCVLIAEVLPAEAVLARIGGEEFAILLPGGDQDAAATIAARICTAVRSATLELAHGPLRVTCSIGAATFGHGDDTAESLHGRSDAALYAAKRGGRDRVVVATVAARLARRNA